MWLDWELALDMATHKETKTVISKAHEFAKEMAYSKLSKSCSFA